MQFGGVEYREARQVGLAEKGFRDPRGAPAILIDMFLELTIELAVQVLGERVVSKERHRRIPPRHRTRAGKIAGAAQQLRGYRGRRRIENLCFADIVILCVHGARHLGEHMLAPIGFVNPILAPLTLGRGIRRRRGKQCSREREIGFRVAGGRLASSAGAWVSVASRG